MTQTITVTLPADVKQAVDELSQKEGVPPDEVVGQAVNNTFF
jgi:predicted transcriptional regulator